VTVHHLPRGEVHVARAEQVYPLLAPGSVRLVISDGPYGMGKAAWDRQRTADDLRAWYAPHVEAWGRVCMEAASVYLWGTAQSVRALQPLMEAHGWTWRVAVTWDKGTGCFAGKIDTEAMTRLYDVTETCDVYTRDNLTPPTGPGTTVQYAAGGDDRNWVRDWLAAEWDATGLRRRDADRAIGANGMSGHYFGRSQWALPTWENYQKLAAYAAEHGVPRARAYFVHPDAAPAGLRASFDHLRAEFEHLRAEFEHLRAEYEAARVPFHHPHGVGNVWSTPIVAGAERLSAPDGGTLHPCQKPLTFYDRIIRASSRPGDTVLEPFGGTLRAAAACEAMPEHEARRYVCAEPDEDGRGYVPAALAAIRAAPVRLL
jgi:hypothetical protein